MGYRIMYSPEDNGKYPMQKKGKGWTIVVVTVLAVVLMFGRPKIRAEFEKWLIPGDPAVTKAAFSLLIEELHDGTPFADAITTFCNEIIAGGKTEIVYAT